MAFEVGAARPMTFQSGEDPIQGLETPPLLRAIPNLPKIRAPKGRPATAHQVGASAGRRASPRRCVNPLDLRSRTLSD